MRNQLHNQILGIYTYRMATITNSFMTLEDGEFTKINDTLAKAGLLDNHIVIKFNINGQIIYGWLTDNRIFLGFGVTFAPDVRDHIRKEDLNLYYRSI